jgi:hypothetical protein
MKIHLDCGLADPLYNQSKLEMVRCARVEALRQRLGAFFAPMTRPLNIQHRKHCEGAKIFVSRGKQLPASHVKSGMSAFPWLSDLI